MVARAPRRDPQISKFRVLPENLRSSIILETCKQGTQPFREEVQTTTALFSHIAACGALSMQAMHKFCTPKGKLCCPSVALHRMHAWRPTLPNRNGERAENSFLACFA